MAYWNSGCSYRDYTKCAETTFYYGRTWVRIRNATGLDQRFDRYWNDNSYGARNLYWEPSSKDVPNHGNTRTVELRDFNRAALTFSVNGADGIKFINLSFTCPLLFSNKAEGCGDDDRFISQVCKHMKSMVHFTCSTNWGLQTLLAGVQVHLLVEL